MSEYPQRVILRDDQPNREAWMRYFEDQYLSECTRLGWKPEPEQLNFYDTSFEMQKP